MQSSTQQTADESAPGTVRDGLKEMQSRWKVGKSRKTQKYLVYADTESGREILKITYDEHAEARAFADAANEMMMRCK